MSYRIALRVAVVLCFIHAVMHQIGMQQPPRNAAEVAITESMNAFQMDVMGSTRSYMDFHVGMGLFLTVMLLGCSALLWVFSTAQGQARITTRPALLAMAITFAAFAAISLKYFFAAPVVMELAVAILALFAWFKAKPVA